MKIEKPVLKLTAYEASDLEGIIFKGANNSFYLVRDNNFADYYKYLDTCDPVFGEADAPVGKGRRVSLDGKLYRAVRRGLLIEEAMLDHYRNDLCSTLNANTELYLSYRNVRADQRGEEYPETLRVYYNAVLHDLRELMDDEAYDPAKVEVVNAKSGKKAADNLCLLSKRTQLPGQTYAVGWFEGNLFEVTHATFSGTFRFGTSPFFGDRYVRCEPLTMDAQARLMLIWVAQGL